ncbi:hypothetical protein FGO68_gene16085 [Halteria grandinella]|uniref:Uncharacterized protein n=1 Tax=Halteria grandinella TaxID=5974 RepID=A0A8J8P1F1_HALGN|nr:hypothetical protein FGO68_gene16085 [Halteria grandinella]
MQSMGDLDEIAQETCICKFIKDFQYTLSISKSSPGFAVEHDRDGCECDNCESKKEEAERFALQKAPSAFEGYLGYLTQTRSEDVKTYDSYLMSMPNNLQQIEEKLFHDLSLHPIMKYRLLQMRFEDYEIGEAQQGIPVFKNLLNSNQDLDKLKGALEKTIKFDKEFMQRIHPQTKILKKEDPADDWGIDAQYGEEEDLWDVDQKEEEINADGGAREEAPDCQFALDMLVAASEAWVSETGSKNILQLNIVQVQGHGIVYEKDNYLVVPEVVRPLNEEELLLPKKQLKGDEDLDTRKYGYLRRMKFLNIKDFARKIALLERTITLIVFDACCEVLKLPQSEETLSMGLGKRVKEVETELPQGYSVLFKSVDIGQLATEREDSQKVGYCLATKELLQLFEKKNLTLSQLIDDFKFKEFSDYEEVIKPKYAYAKVLAPLDEQKQIERTYQFAKQLKYEASKRHNLSVAFSFDKFSRDSFNNSMKAANVLERTDEVIKPVIAKIFQPRNIDIKNCTDIDLVVRNYKMVRYLDKQKKEITKQESALIIIDITKIIIFLEKENFYQYSNTVIPLPKQFSQVSCFFKLTRLCTIIGGKGGLIFLDLSVPNSVSKLTLYGMPFKVIKIEPIALKRQRNKFLIAHQYGLTIFDIKLRTFQDFVYLSHNDLQQAKSDTNLFEHGVAINDFSIYDSQIDYVVYAIATTKGLRFIKIGIKTQASSLAQKEESYTLKIKEEMTLNYAFHVQSVVYVQNRVVIYAQRNELYQDQKYEVRMTDGRKPEKKQKKLQRDAIPGQRMYAFGNETILCMKNISEFGDYELPFCVRDDNWEEAFKRMFIIKTNKGLYLMEYRAIAIQEPAFFIIQLHDRRDLRKLHIGCIDISFTHIDYNKTVKIYTTCKKDTQSETPSYKYDSKPIDKSEWARYSDQLLQVTLSSNEKYIEQLDSEKDCFLNDYKMLLQDNFENQFSQYDK